MKCTSAALNRASINCLALGSSVPRADTFETHLIGFDERVAFIDAHILKLLAIQKFMRRVFAKPTGSSRVRQR